MVNKICKNKFIVSVIIGLTFVIIVSVLFLYNKNNNEIPQDYIAVFNGGGGEIGFQTYIYKIDNGKANYGFKYINTRWHTVSWGSKESYYEITGRGKIAWTDEVFTVAKNNYAYSYVVVPNDEKIYTIEEFMYRFLMD